MAVETGRAGCGRPSEVSGETGEMRCGCWGGTRHGQ